MAEGFDLLGVIGLWARREPDGLPLRNSGGDSGEGIGSEGSTWQSRRVRPLEVRRVGKMTWRPLFSVS